MEYSNLPAHAGETSTIVPDKYRCGLTSPEEAHAAYCRAAAEHHGEFARVA
jgi:hypothetical protein